MLMIDVMPMAMEVMDIVFCDEGDNDCVRFNGDGDGRDGHCYRIEADVMTMVTDIVIAFKL